MVFGAALAYAMLWADEAPRLEPPMGMPPHPADNPGTPERILLGETMLSSGRQRSCSTCHKPELYFTDGFSRCLPGDD